MSVAVVAPCDSSSSSDLSKQSHVSHFKVAMLGEDTLAARSVTPDLRAAAKPVTALARAADPKDTVVGDPPVSLETENPGIDAEMLQGEFYPASHWKVRPRRSAAVKKPEEEVVADSKQAKKKKVGRPKPSHVKKNGKRGKDTFLLKVKCNSSVMETMEVPRDLMQSTAPSVPPRKTAKSRSAPAKAAKTRTVHQKLQFKALFDDYHRLVDQRICEPVNFWTSLGQAEKAISKKLDELEDSLSEDPDVVAEQKDYRRCLRQIQRFEDQEKLSIQMDRLEWLEGKTKRVDPSLREKRKLKEMESEKRSFCDAPLLFAAPGPTKKPSLGECHCIDTCNICPTTGIAGGTVKIDPLTPQVRRVDFFALEEDDEEPVEQTGRRAEDSAIALKSLLHSLEFVAQEKKTI